MAALGAGRLHNGWRPLGLDRGWEPGVGSIRLHEDAACPERDRAIRDRSDIGKIGSCEILVRDATKRAGRFWWDGISRLESSRGVSAVFEKPADYQALEQVLRETRDMLPMRICAYAVMPNRWPCC